jgi:hypothetical protein
LKGYKALAWSAILISLVLLVLPRGIPICTGLAGAGSPMRCHYAYQAEFLVTLLVLILAVSLLVSRTTEAQALSGFVILLAGIIIVILPLPWVIGICTHGGACLKTAFFTTIGGSLLSLAGAAIIWLTRKNKEVKQTDEGKPNS